MPDKILQAQAQMTGCRLGDNKSLFLSFHTNENLTDEQRTKIQNWHRETGHLTFSVKQVNPEDLLSLPEIKSDEKKTPSQRLRAVIYIWWEQRGKQGDFDTFYRDQIEKIINQVKEKLT